MRTIFMMLIVCSSGSEDMDVVDVEQEAEMGSNSLHRKSSDSCTNPSVWAIKWENTLFCHEKATEEARKEVLEVVQGVSRGSSFFRLDVRDFECEAPVPALDAEEVKSVPSSERYRIGWTKPVSVAMMVWHVSSKHSSERWRRSKLGCVRR